MIAHANLTISSLGDALFMTSYIFSRAPNNSISTIPYELWFCKKPSWTTYAHGVDWMCAQSNPKYGQLGLRATMMVFISYPLHSK